MRISDWSSDVCSSDLERLGARPAQAAPLVHLEIAAALVVAAVEVLGRRDAALGRRCAKGIEDLPRQALRLDAPLAAAAVAFVAALRSEEHTSELQSLMRISYAVFC